MRGLRLSKVGLTRVAVVGGAVAALEILCRSGVIPRATMIPPIEMVAAMWQILRSGRANSDIAFTVVNLFAAVVLSVVVGFGLGVVIIVVHRHPEAIAVEPEDAHDPVAGDARHVAAMR